MNYVTFLKKFLNPCGKAKKKKKKIDKNFWGTSIWTSISAYSSDPTKGNISLLQGKCFWRECYVVDIVSVNVDVELLISNHPHKIIAYDMITLVNCNLYCNLYCTRNLYWKNDWNHLTVTIQSSHTSWNSALSLSLSLSLIVASAIWTK